MRSTLPILLAGLLSAFSATQAAAQGALLAGPTALEFVVPDGASQPLPQSVFVASNGAVLNFEAHASASWLFVSQTWGTTPATLSVTVDATALPNGVYQDIISLTSGTATPALVSVTLRVGGPPKALPVAAARPPVRTLRAFPQGFTFVAKTGIVPQPQSLFVPRSPQEDGVTGSTSAPWLTVSQTQPASSPNFQEIQLSANPTGLASGQYSTSVVLRTRAGTERTIPVTFNVGDEAHLVAEPSVLEFRAQPNGAMPGIQTITIKSTSAHLKYTASTTSGSWLAIGAQTGATDGNNTVSVAVNPANLTTGANTGSITLTAPGAAESLVIPVTLTPAGAGGLAVDAGIISLTGTAPGPVQTYTVHLTSATGGETFSVDALPAWLNISPLTGTAPATLTVSADPNVTGVNQVSKQVFISGGLPGDAAIFQVNFTVTAGSASAITPNPTSLSFSYTAGNTPASKQITLSGTAGTSFTATTDSNALTVSPSSGTLPATLTVSVSSNISLNNVNVIVTGGANTGTNALKIPVTVNVTVPQTGCTLSVAGNQITRITFNSFQGQTPPAQTVTLSCASTLSFTATKAQAFTTVSPTTGTVTPTTPVTLTVSVAPGSLTPQSYGDVIEIKFSDTSLLDLIVVYNVTSNTTITATPSSLNFTQAQGGAAPAKQTIMLTSGTPTTFSITSNSGIVSLDKSSGSTPATITVSVDAGTQTPGFYSVTLAVIGGSVETDITVNVTVTAPTSAATIVATPAALTFTYTAGQSLPNAQTTQLTTTTNVSTPFAASSNKSWLDVAPTSGSTNQLLTLTVNSNANALGTGSFMATVTVIGGATTLTIPVTLNIQPSTGTGTITASPNSLTFTALLNGSAPNSQTVTLSSTPATTFTAASTQSWLLVSPTSGTTGTNNLTVSVVTAGMGVGTYNGSITVTPTGAGVTGLVSIAVTLTISSTAITASPTSLSFVQIQNAAAPAAQTVSLTAPSTTSFTIGFTQSWLSVSPTTNSTPATLTVTANGSSLPPGNYSDTITVTGGSTTVTVSVSLIVLSPSSSSIIPSAQAVAFTSSLGDTAFKIQQLTLTSSTSTAINFSASTNATWLTVMPSTGTTPATLTLNENPAGLTAGSYTATLTIIGGAATLTIPVMLTISVAPNAITATPSSVSFSQFIGGTAPGSQTVQLTSTNPTAFTASNTQTWLTVTPASGTTNTSLTLAVNPSGLLAGTYQDTITINGGAFPVSIPVSYTISPDTFVPTPASLSFTQTLGGAAPASQSVQLASGVAHTYMATSSASWLTVSPATGTSPATLTVSVNGSSLTAGTYNGTITVVGAGSPVTIAVTLTVAVATGAVFSPTSVTFSVAAGTTAPSTQTVTVSSSAAQFSFAATATVSNGGSGTGNWLSVSPATGTTPATLTITASPANLASGQYSGIITVTPTDGSIPTQNLSVTLTIAGGSSSAFVKSVLSAASFQPGPVSPGELISLFGLGLGPATGVTAKPLASGAFDITLAGTQVFFDGVPAPLLYAQAGQVNAIVPYNVYGRTTTSMTTSISGAVSAPIGLAVQNTAPAVFTVNGSGTGQTSVLNQDGSINGPNFPAPAGSVIAIYGTGEGQTSPPGQDGRIISTDLRRPLASYSAQIGGLPATVQYMGSAPTLVSGVFQMNVVIPSGLSPGQQPLQLTIGGVTTQVGITVAVKN